MPRVPLHVDNAGQVIQLDQSRDLVHFDELKVTCEKYSVSLFQSELSYIEGQMHL